MEKEHGILHWLSGLLQDNKREQLPRRNRQKEEDEEGKEMEGMLIDLI